MTSNEPSSSLFDKIFARKNKKKSTSSGSGIIGSNGAGNTSPKEEYSNQRISSLLLNDEITSYIDQNQKSPVINKSPFKLTNSNQLIVNNNNNSNYSQNDLCEQISAANFNENINDLSPIKEEESKQFDMSSINSDSAILLTEVMHRLHVTNYLTPTYCDYCSQLLIGLIKQGLKCEICGQNYHKRCIQHMPKICNRQLNMVLSRPNNPFRKSYSQINLNNLIINNLNDNSSNSNKLEIEHTFIKKQIYNIYRSILTCDHCQLKFNNDKFYLNCKDCRISVHLKCGKQAKRNCRPNFGDDDQDQQASSMYELNAYLTNNNYLNSPKDNLTVSSDNSESTLITHSSSSMNIENDIRKMSLDEQKLDDETFRDFQYDNDTELIDYDNDNNNNNHNHSSANKNRISDIIEEDATITTVSNARAKSDTTETENEDNEVEAKKYKENFNNSTIKHFRPGPRNSRKKTQIRLQRLSQRVKKTSGYFWSGHMFYYTNINPQFTTHYWKLDSISINIYDSYRQERNLKEIKLENIKKASLCGLSINSKEDFINDQKCLFTLRTENEIYYCGMGNADQNSTMNVLARNFYNIFKMVYLPYGNRHGIRKSLKISAPKYEEKNLQDEYLINPQELLGSGQFGQVYGGICKANNQSVAIKVIDKTRFKDFQAETSVFQNEITILYNVQHPGIVKLFALFDEIDHLYIVTEKMATDMLEMILNKQPPRLSERAAKFIIYQILIALNKLHDRNIAHCDLKPENILLTENVEFPQVKICDFGYAKIIGENSFRRSMVGTPAYSPPELKQKRLYNNSIDMWSMGVIVYVSLSGTFPFEEDRDIYEQIMNSNFMFPADPWENVSSDAIDLINHFLQVKIDRRMSVNKALQHRWFSEDFDLYNDLINLETKLNQKWLTTKEQEEKWNQSIHL